MTKALNTSTPWRHNGARRGARGVQPPPWRMLPMTRTSSCSTGPATRIRHSIPPMSKSTAIRRPSPSSATRTRHSQKLRGGLQGRSCASLLAERGQMARGGPAAAARSRRRSKAGTTCSRHHEDMKDLVDAPRTARPGSCLRLGQYRADLQFTDKVDETDVQSLKAFADPKFRDRVSIGDNVDDAYALASLAIGLKDWTQHDRRAVRSRPRTSCARSTRTSGSTGRTRTETRAGDGRRRSRSRLGLERHRDQSAADGAAGEDEEGHGRRSFDMGLRLCPA